MIVAPNKIELFQRPLGPIEVFFWVDSDNRPVIAEITCGHCNARSRQEIPGYANWASCKCCGTKNVW